ncbi:MAG: M12 family metallopeptidase [Pyrinomonadaceae bacterium]
MATKGSKSPSKSSKGSKAAKKGAGSKAGKATKAVGGGSGKSAADALPDDLVNIRACADKALPPELAGAGVTAAVDERPDNILMPGMTPMFGMAANALDMPAIAVVAKKLWKPGRTLRVRFLDSPSQTVRQKIEKFAREWEQYVNIRFSFVSSGSAEIRITTTVGLGSWSYLGTDNLLIAASKPTMNYGWFTSNTPDEEFRRTTLHEFGHALGCIHEHMNPVGNIPWNVDAVYRYYMTTQGWTKADVDAQVLAKYSIDQLNTSKYDPKSIMHYPVPKELTLGQSFSVGWNTKLSKTDKSFMRQMYP